MEYYTLWIPNRDGLVSVGKIHESEKRLKEFGARSSPDPNLELLKLYANVLSGQVSERLDLKISPFIKERSNYKFHDSDLSYDLHLIHGWRDIRYCNGDCILKADVAMEDNMITRNMIKFEQLARHEVSLVDIVKRVSDMFAMKAMLKFDYLFVDAADPMRITLQYSKM